MTKAPTIDNRLFGRMLRILRVETADHPMMAEALKKNWPIIADLEWADRKKVACASERLADAIEDHAGYRGEALQYYINETWLPKWREACHKALLKAQAERMGSLAE